MPIIKYRVCLSAEERKELLNIISKGAASARAIMRANVLLTIDENSIDGRKSEAEIAKLFHVKWQTVHYIRKQYAKKGLTANIGRKNGKHHQLSP